MIVCEYQTAWGQPRLARIRDLSECGIKLATPEPLVVGGYVRIKLPGMPHWISARVVWSQAGTAGLAFSRAVDLPAIAGINPVPAPGQHRAGGMG